MYAIRKPVTYRATRSKVLRSVFNGFTRLFSPISLFAASEPGVWYDPSDMTTLFQDSAGTTPVTAVEQPVGLMLDKSGRGNHATQSTSASRPVLSARVNLLTKTEAFDDAAWTKTNTTVTANAAVAPDGTATGEKIVQAAGTRALNQDGPLQVIAVNGDKSISVSAKQNTARYLALGYSNGAGITATAVFDLQDGTLSGSSFHPSACTSVATSIVAQGNGWYRCSFGLVGSANAMNIYHFTGSTIGASGLYNRDITGDGTSGIYVWGADLRVTNDGVSLPAYQRVNTSTDYDTTGFPKYLRFDGVDDGMVTGSIDFTSTDKMSVFAGVRKLSSIGYPVILELSASVDSNNGAFSLLGSGFPAASPGYIAQSRGTVLASSSVAVGFAEPVSNVLTTTFDISIDRNILRANGTQIATGPGNQGTGNYLAYPLYIGRRGNVSNPYNGRLYSLIVRGAATSDALITSTETWVNGKTGAY